MASPTLGLNNGNTIGVELVAADDKDVTPAQIAAAKGLYGNLATQYPGIGAIGHGALNVDNPGHRQADEGLTVTNAIKSDPNLAPLVHALPQQNAKSEPVPISARNLNTYIHGEVAPTPPANIPHVGPQSSFEPSKSAIDHALAFLSALNPISSAHAEEAKFGAPAWVGASPQQEIGRAHV